MVILPGTKNTIHDLLWMRQNGLEAAILSWLTAGCLYGESAALPDDGEAGGRKRGWSQTFRHGHPEWAFFPKTEFEEEKIRTRVEGVRASWTAALAGCRKSIEGYEIHMGRTYIDREEGVADTARILSSM